MDLYELEQSEHHPAYQRLMATNIARHYDFLLSMIEVSVATNRTWLSEFLIKAINFHAIVGLHHQAGRYRSHEVCVGEHTPPAHYRVEPLMNDFVNWVNRSWDSEETIKLAATALWRINNIHPFVNGNGRTARAVCYFILSVKSGGILPGKIILPEMLRSDSVRQMQINCLQQADKGNLAPLTDLIRHLITQQIKNA